MFLIKNDYCGQIQYYFRDKKKITEIILHHTVTPTAESTVRVLKDRGLGYHYLIDKNLHVFVLADPEDMTYHAAGFNKHSVGIAFVCGGQFGPVSEGQVKQAVELANYLKKRIPTLKTVAGHKHRSKSGKIDPDGMNDKEFIDFANKTGLEFVK